MRKHTCENNYTYPSLTPTVCKLIKQLLIRMLPKKKDAMMTITL